MEQRGASGFQTALPENVNNHEAGEMAGLGTGTREEAESAATQARCPGLALPRVLERDLSIKKRVKIKAPCANTVPSHGPVRGTRIRPLVFNHINYDLWVDSSLK